MHILTKTKVSWYFNESDWNVNKFEINNLLVCTLNMINYNNSSTKS